MSIPRLAWLEIDSSAIKNNLLVIKKTVGPEAGIMAVVKANAYGHGAFGIAKIAEEAEVAMLGVSAFYEAKQLREAGIKLPILILGYTPVENTDDLVNYDITTTIKNPDVAKALVTAARRKNKVAKVWVKVDTGMHRLGLEPEQVLVFIKKLQDLPNLEIEGIFTHFADADDDAEFTKEQLASFKKVIKELETSGIKIPIKSAAASAAIFGDPDSHFNMVRPGLAMLGINRNSKTIFNNELKPALTFKTEVAQIHELKVGETVGYGRAFRVKRPSRIATLTVGYGDGFRRAPYNWGEVLIRGYRVPLAGRVSMDQAAADITDIPEDVRVGEEVVLVGKSGEEVITVEEVANKLQTSPYEVVVNLANRVTRIYK
ncbi:MAG: alanine racemase [Candidatus Woykebacteria bacterium RIFCSPHIGHO2_12_FULL_45_10]|uniref:Alanine racemase n=1 Tax=Candidatus Woykebacteria bacterium RIFCSPHIGHO2_12_FULL_45_10 TaxID=1802603 RepID=A0A1G1WMQ3_9BACT|nr:MAG: alanine racemase [Candidatus Woykebacteria bacterium RIFCSPHIGHO2_12_FULL_45_10]